MSAAAEEFDGELHNHQRIGPRRMYNGFDFSLGRRFSKKLGQRVHVIKMLIELKDDPKLTQEDRDALKYAIRYMKTLERHIETREVIACPVSIKVNVVPGPKLPDVVKSMFGGVFMKKEVRNV